MKLIQSVKRRMASDLKPVSSSTNAASTNRGEGSPHSQSSLASLGRHKTEEVNPFANLPILKDAPLAERPELFRKKLAACATLYDFNSSLQSSKEKEAKRLTLLELVEYVNQAKNCFTEVAMQELVSTVSSNIFRTLPPLKQRNPLAIYDPEDEEPTLEASWPHLQLIYELFLRFTVSNDADPKIAKKFIDQVFILRLLDLFDSEDPRERDYLKTILHRLYGKFMAHRAFIRKSIQNLFFKIIYESELHNGVAELLEILGSIINGFALPLKDEHKQFLEKSLIPLHKVKTLNSFHQQLSYCMTQYVEKDPRLAEPIVLGLLRFWPSTCSPKEVLFIGELEEILELTQRPEFVNVEQPLLRRVANCITSSHFQVSERILFLWNNETVLNLFMGSKATVYPPIVAALYKNTKAHWNTQVHGLTYNVLKALMDADSALFDQVSAQYKSDEGKDELEQQDRDRIWSTILGKSSRNPAPTVA